MTEQKVEYDTIPKDLNELKERVEATGTDWKDALAKVEKVTGKKTLAAAMKEGWTVADFAKLLLNGHEGEEPKASEQNLPQADYGFTEAPASFNVKALSPQGFDVMLTLRDADTKALMDRAQKALAWLAKQGYQPTGRRSNGGNNATNDNDDTKVCPVHHVTMRKREKHGETWWSHKAVNPDTKEEYWCKGVAK